MSAGTSTASLDTREWDAAVRSLMAASKTGFRGEAADKVIRQCVGLVARDAYKMTPPFGKAPVTESLSTQRKVGIKALTGDVRSIYMGVGEAVEAARRMSVAHGAAAAKLAAKGDLNGLVKFMRGASQGPVQVKAYQRGGHVVAGYMRTGSLPGMSGYSGLRESAARATKAIHDKNRNAKTGRVKARRPSVLVGSDKSVETYIKSASKRIGKAKSGWHMALEKYGQKAASWTGQARAEGIAPDESGNGKLAHVIGNRIGYIQRVGEELRIMQRAVTSQVGNLAKRIEAAIQHSVTKRRF